MTFTEFKHLKIRNRPDDVIFEEALNILEEYSREPDHKPDEVSIYFWVNAFNLIYQMLSRKANAPIAD